jgi:hypothetical protein
MESKRVFISHAGEDKERFVMEFAKRLREHGVDAWVDKWEILPGDSLVDKIFEEGIKNAQAIVVVLSQYSVDKPWVREELNAGFIKRLSGKCRLIPVVIDDCNIPQALASVVWQRIPDLENYDEEFIRIIDGIYGQSRKPPLGPPISVVRRDRFRDDLTNNRVPTSLSDAEYDKEDIKNFIVDGSEPPTLRLSALRIYLSLGLKSAKLLIDLLDDPDTNIRRTVLRHIHKNPDPEVIELIDAEKAQQMMQDPEDEVVVAATRLACDLVCLDRIPWRVLTTVNRHPYFLVRKIAIGCIVETNDPNKLDLVYEFRTTSYHVSQRLIRDYVERLYEEFSDDEKQKTLDLLEHLKNAKRATKPSKDKTEKLLKKLRND